MASPLKVKAVACKALNIMVRAPFQSLGAVYLHSEIGTFCFHQVYGECAHN